LSQETVAAGRAAGEEEWEGTGIEIGDGAVLE
jgi:hypothetical protein